MQLFDDFARTRTSDKDEDESDYNFLNTSAFRSVHRARQYTQEWFNQFPKDAQADWRGRFVSKKHEQHVSAQFELLLHELLRRLEFSIEVHPTINGLAEHPDFRITNGDRSFYLEAVVIYPRRDRRKALKRERLVHKWLNELDSPDFSFLLNDLGVLREQPKKQYIQPIQKFIEKYNPDEVQADINENGIGSAPYTWISIGSWKLRVRLIPKLPHLRGDRGSRNIAGHPGGGGGTPDASRIVKKIEDKLIEKQSGKLDAPLVIAAKVMDDLFSVGEDAITTLLGWPEQAHLYERSTVTIGTKRQPPGVWLDRNGKPQHRNVQAVWLFEAMPSVAPTPTAQLDSVLVFNPITTITLPRTLDQLPHYRELEGKMQRVSGVGLNELLGIEALPQDQWH